MGKEATAPPPRKKDPGLLGRLFSTLSGCVFWVLMSLVFSVFIEWVGIATVWKQEGSRHSQTQLAYDLQYLNQRVVNGAGEVSTEIWNITLKANSWFAQHSRIDRFIQWVSIPALQNDSAFRQKLHRVYVQYEEYVLCIPYVIQMFFTRIAVIVLSLPSFVLFALVGMIDGLVERDLRRRGGGRESSVMYNLARKSILPLFVLSCVMYLSLPINMHPAIIIMPFALGCGVLTRVTFERFKKYF